MSQAGTNGHAEAEARRTARRRTPWPLAVVAALFVIVPFAYWYGTWFGRGLSDEQVEKYLGETNNPRHVQHALSQIAERVEKEGGVAERWLPRVVEAASSPFTDVRMTAAWVMGLDHRREEFRAALLRLLEDPEPVVRRNAALALVRFGDERCRPELLAMLRPLTVTSDAEGQALTVLSEGTTVKRDTMMAQLRSGERVEEVRSPLPGRIEKALVKEGDAVERGRELFRIAPDAAQARDALIGLAYFGRAEDLPELERYAAGVEGMAEEVKKQAAATVDAVRRRAKGNP